MTAGETAAPAARATAALPDLFELSALVREAAIETHDAFHILSRGKVVRTVKADGGWVTDVDRRIQDILLAGLRRRWPQFGFIGEEMTHADQIAVCDHSREGYWVLDPLDGTTNFTAGFPFYGVSLALVINDQPCCGVVFDPVRGECFSAQIGHGAYLNQQPLTGPANAPGQLRECIAIIDYKRIVGDLAEQLVRSPPYRSPRNLGASALEWCWLAAGRAQLYLHGGQKLWDFAAGSLILSEAGGAANSLSGQPLDCSRMRKRSVVAASNPQLLARWNAWLNASSASPKASPL